MTTPAIKESIAAALLALGLLLAMSAAEARTQNVEAWVDSDLAEYVAGQLRDLPRFRGSTLRFVVFESGRPATQTNEFALRLRDRLQRRMIEHGVARIGWQPDPSVSGVRLPPPDDPCAAGNIEILVGLEARSVDADKVEYSVRALDAAEQTWVPGFARVWHGTLSREQRRARARTSVDRTFLGERGVPYGHTETDLIARHLAHDLTCQLMRQVSGEYAVAPPDGDHPETFAEAGRILALIRNQVASVRSLKLKPVDSGANAVLEGELHAIDRGLHQFWVTVMPTDAAAGLQPLSASVYVDLPDASRPFFAEADRDAGLSAPGAGILDGLKVVRIGVPSGCSPWRGATLTGSYRQGGDDCAALRLSTRRDAVVFVLNYQLNRGLVHLSGGRCNSRPAARVSKAGETTTVLLPERGIDGDWLVQNRWLERPAADTYYTIAVSDSKAAHAIAAQVSKLPQRCTESVRAGFRAARLESWMRQFERELLRWGPAVDWQAIRMRRLY